MPLGTSWGDNANQLARRAVSAQWSKGDSVKPLNLDELTGTLAIGSMIVGGAALGIQAVVDLKPFVTYVVSLASWEPLIAVPAFFVSYLTGLITVKLSAIWFDNRRREPAGTAARRLVLVGAQAELVVEEYKRLIRERELLQSACPAMLLFAASLALKTCMTTSDLGGRLRGGRVIFIGGDLLLIALIPVTLLLVRRSHRALLALLAALDEPRAS
ncbi:MAG TPA: hypothetical protein VGJ91_08305 [Polyangiaceae bacterium]|jgi:hypothetical protein